MRAPLILGMMILGLVAFKVAALGSLLLGVAVLIPTIFLFLIVGVILFGLVALTVWGIRFMAFCLGIYKYHEPPVAQMGIPPQPARPAYRNREGRPRPVPPPPSPPFYAANWSPGRRRRPVRGFLIGTIVIAAIALSGLFLVQGHRTRARIDNIFADSRLIGHDAVARRFPPPPKHSAHRNRATASSNESDLIAAPEEPRAHEEVAKIEENEQRTWEEFGVGDNYPDARQNALEKAYSAIRLYLLKQDPPIQWVPSLEYINDHLVKSAGEAEQLDLGPPLGKARQARVQLAITAADMDLIRQQDRHYRTDARLLLVAKIFGGILAGLALVGGFVRLRERSKGFVTGWMMLAATLIIAAGSTLIYFFFSTNLADAF